MISNVIKGLHLNVFTALKSLYDYENVFHILYPITDSCLYMTRKVEKLVIFVIIAASIFA